MDSPEHERRNITQYVEIEAGDEEILRAEKISSEVVFEQRYDVWDVETDQNRWWVITNATNLYLQSEFKSMDHVLSFHIGLMQRVFAKNTRKAHTGEEESDRLRVAWRKWEQAAQAMDQAEEAEDFQAIGMRCREALLDFVRAVAHEAMVPNGEEKPKGADFVRWSQHIAAAVAPTSSRLRAYLRRTAASTWELVNWLTHEANARRIDGILATDATAHVLNVFGMALVRHERGEPDRCPECRSYRLAGDYRPEADVYVTLCEACKWQSEPRDGRHADADPIS